MTLTRKQQKTLNSLGTDWETVEISPESKTLKQLEKRGLIEIRIDPSIDPKTAMALTLLGDRTIWQVRRV